MRVHGAVHWINLPRSYKFENWKSLYHILVNCIELINEGILREDEPLFETLYIFYQYLSVTDFCFHCLKIFESEFFFILFVLNHISNFFGMDELASISVWAVMILMVLLTEFGLVSRWNMLFLLKLMLSMGKRTHFTIWTWLSFNPTFAQFSLDLDFVVFG